MLAPALPPLSPARRHDQEAKGKKLGEHKAASI